MTGHFLATSGVSRSLSLSLCSSLYSPFLRGKKKEKSDRRCLLLRRTRRIRCKKDTRPARAEGASRLASEYCHQRVRMPPICLSPYLIGPSKVALGILLCFFLRGHTTCTGLDAAEAAVPPTTGTSEGWNSQTLHIETSRGVQVKTVMIRDDADDSEVPTCKLLYSRSLVHPDCHARGRIQQVSSQYLLKSTPKLAVDT